MEKDDLLFRADIDYRGTGCWYDNIMIDWDTTNYLIPAEIKMMFQFENEEQRYAVVHSCHNKYTELTVLSQIWIKGMMMVL